MTSAFFRKFCLATAALLPAGAQALYDGDLVSIRGFGTLGIAWNSANEASFKRDVIQPDGPRGDLSWRTDTRLGLQIATHTASAWDATAQVLSKYTADGNFDPELIWGFVEYRPTETLTLRGGRLGWDVFLLADSRQVGYSYMWARPPVEFFGSRQIYSFDGMDASATWTVGDGLLQAKVFGGTGDQSVGLNDDVKVDVNIESLAGINLNYHSGDWEFQLGHTRIELGLGISGSFELPSPDSGAPPISIPLDDTPELSADLILSSAGVIGHHGPWEVQLQYAYIHSKDDEVTPSFDGAYISAGYRIGKWMPYASYATTSIKGENGTDAPRSDPGDIPAGPGGINAGPGQHTYSIGARYDVRENMALKFQVDRIHARNHTFWADVEPGWDGRATVVSATLDFVF